MAWIRSACGKHGFGGLDRITPRYGKSGSATLPGLVSISYVLLACRLGVGSWFALEDRFQRVDGHPWATNMDDAMAVRT
jgi:hypothetical protein